MSEPIIDSSDLASYRGANTDIILELANELVLDIIGDLTPLPARVRAITLEVAARATRNPDGVTSQTSSIDDWTRTKRWEAAAQAGVYVSDAERVELLSFLSTTPIQPRGSIKLHVPGYSQ